MQGKVSYNWFDVECCVLKEHADHFRTQAVERANQMIQHGYTEGELHTSVVVDGKEQDYRGWWKHG
jgi:uncharacterized protein YdaT